MHFTTSWFTSLPQPGQDITEIGEGWEICFILCLHCPWHTVRQTRDNHKFPPFDHSSKGEVKRFSGKSLTFYP